MVTEGDECQVTERYVLLPNTSGVKKHHYIFVGFYHCLLVLECTVILPSSKGTKLFKSVHLGYDEQAEYPWA